MTTPSGTTTWGFNLSLGSLASLRRHGHELLTEPFAIDFYRALTDNDRGSHFGREWRESRLHQTRTHVQEVKWEKEMTPSTHTHGLRLQVFSKVSPPVLAWSVQVVTTYHFQGEGLHIFLRVEPPHGLPPHIPTTLARIGFTAGIDGVEKVRWWGRGPGESYCDKKTSQGFGTWERPVDELFMDYEFPQEGGTRTDVRWVEFLGRSRRRHGGISTGTPRPERLLRAQFGNLDDASFSASRYSTADLDACAHPYELHRRKRKDTLVRLDCAHHGLGTGSCGPATLPEYQLRTDKGLTFTLHLN